MTIEAQYLRPGDQFRTLAGRHPTSTWMCADSVSMRSPTYWPDGVIVHWHHPEVDTLKGQLEFRASTDVDLWAGISEEELAMRALAL